MSITVRSADGPEIQRPRVINPGPLHIWVLRILNAVCETISTLTYRPKIYLLHRFGPFRFASAEHGGAVFLKNPPLLHQFVECVGITGQIVVPVGVALRNGLARIA